MNQKHKPWDRTTRVTIEQRLLQGERVTAIAQDFGMKPNAFGYNFRKAYGKYPPAWALEKNPELANERNRSPRTLPVNEHYFDSFTEEPSKHVAYVLGLLTGRPAPKNDYFILSSKNETLIDIIKSELEAEHRTVDTLDGVQTLRIYGVHYLSATLASLGIQGASQNRPFPDMPLVVLQDFMRGIVEGNVSVSLRNKKTPRIQFNRFGTPFLRTMHTLLQEHAQVQREGPIGKTFSYCGRNALKVGEFIYADAAYLEDTGLYVPEIREKLLPEK